MKAGFFDWSFYDPGNANMNLQWEVGHEPQPRDIRSETRIRLPLSGPLNRRNPSVGAFTPKRSLRAFFRPLKLWFPAMAANGSITWPPCTFRKPPTSLSFTTPEKASLSSADFPSTLTIRWCPLSDPLVHGLRYRGGR